MARAYCELFLERIRGGLLVVERVKGDTEVAAPRDGR
jgi:hypothetical protein